VAYLTDQFQALGLEPGNPDGTWVQNVPLVGITPADGDTMTTPFGTATLLAMAVVTPEQSAPMIATTPSAVIRRSAALEAAAASMQVESARIGSSVAPPSRLPELDASEKASSAPAAIAGVSDSIGPVKPRMMPTLISSAEAVADSASSVDAISIFFISFSLRWLVKDSDCYIFRGDSGIPLRGSA
jgi:hypothetical protein